MINGAFAGVALNLYPGIKHINATPDQVAKIQLGRDQPLFAIYSGYQLTRTEVEGSTDQTEGFGFYVGLLDTFESDSVQQDNILRTAEIMAEQALEQVEAIGEDIALSIRNVRKTPVRKRGGETTSGIWCELDVSINRCGPNEYPSLAEFTAQIGRKTDPYDWKGIVKNENSRAWK